MVREDEYVEGFDALLSGRINPEDLNEMGEQLLYHFEYILPFVGTYRKIKEPKGKRSTWGIIGWSLYSIPFLIKVAYLGTGLITKEWNPANHFRNIIEKFQEKKENKENKLEKTIDYENISK
jgi:hypothetical protein